MEEYHTLFPDNKERLLEIWVDLFWATYFHILSTTGLRMSEARALKWKDVKTDLIIINKAIKANEKEGETKAEYFRPVYFLKSIRNELSELKEISSFVSDDDYIFIRTGNKPVSRRTILTYFNKGLENACISRNDRNIVPHSFRHFANTFLLENFNIETA